MEEAKKILGDDFSKNTDFINSVVEELHLPKSAKVLDIGTGRGHMAIILGVNGYEVITGEPSEDQWADWRSLAKRVGVEDKIRFTPFKAEKLPFNDGEFDAIFLNSTLHHVKNKRKALNECFRALKQKGILIIFELTEEGVKSVRKRFHDHPEAIDPSDYLEKDDLSIKITKGGELQAFIIQP